jgi:hypothetical protein
VAAMGDGGGIENAVRGEQFGIDPKSLLSM